MIDRGIDTVSLCPVCYRKVGASIFKRGKEAWMKKTCPVHGNFESMVERSWNHFSSLYRYGSTGNNNSIIVHIWNQCNMKCSWCYFGEDEIYGLRFLNQLLFEPYRKMQPRPFSLMLSGGEPTINPDYHEIVETAFLIGWKPSTITNMISLADEEFFKRTMNPAWKDSAGNYRFACSMQHPKNYSDEILQKKLTAWDRIEKENLKVGCAMFSVQDLSELEWIKEFYDQYRHLFSMLRIRTMFHNWRNKGPQQIFQSELYEAFMDVFGEQYTPVQCSEIEQSTAYGMYLQTNEGRHVSLMAAPTVENIDYHLASRPVHMLGKDLRCYPVPICQIINEGIEKGWKDGFSLSAG